MRFIIAEAVSVITYLLLVFLVGNGSELEIGFARFVVPLVIVIFLWAWMRWVENSSIAVLDLIDWRRICTGLFGGIAQCHQWSFGYSCLKGHLIQRSH